MARLTNSRVPVMCFFCITLASWFPELISMATVTLHSIEIFKTHDFPTTEPTVYFHCKGERQTILPDVKKTHILYTFKGEESWQPLTDFPNNKCKRCGFYEKDNVASDDVFGEWEFCPADFTDPDGKYIRSVDNEFNSTFVCRDCVPHKSDSDHASGSQKGGLGMHWAVVILISVLVSTAFVFGLLVAYKYWQKKKREKDQARFLKLFEDGDDIEDELGIGPLGGAI